ncbi:MAG: hypothetical protein KDJ99_13390 [Candidatus Competibacteraceae bacterium]|nr:hypothetical protein [Candidatus Competibacteraceae bacterium]
MPKLTTSWHDWLAERELVSLIDLPSDVTKQPWQPDEQDRIAAWELYTELRTRITTQPLHYLAGEEAAALTSIYQLFPETRAIIRKYPKSSHFATLSVFVLNQVVRPFTAQWHKWKLEGHLDTEDTRHDFRRELNALQVKLRRFMTLLGHLAQGDRFVPGSESGHITQLANYNLGEPITLALVPCTGIGSETAQTMQRMLSAELEDIAVRRQTLELPDDGKDGTGLALSGGGIRSATVALGVLQSLGERGLLRCVDYLSTVSGGGYTGSFLSAYLDNADDTIGLQRQQKPFLERGQPESEAIQHLRNNSRYLLSGGLLGQLTFIAQLLFGIAVQLLIILVLIGAAAWFTKQYLGEPSATEGGVSWYLQIGLYVLVALTALLPLVQRLCYDAENSLVAKLPGFFERAAVGALLAVVLFGFWDGMVYLHQNGYLSWLTSWGPPPVMIVAVIVVPLLIAGLAFYFGAATPLGKALLLTTMVTTALLWLATYYVILDSITVDDSGKLEWWPWLSGLSGWFVIVAIVLLLIFVNINLISLHRFYRNRLGEAYLFAQGSDNATVPVKAKRLSALGSQSRTTPYHLINAALNVTRTNNPALQRRGCDFFLFSKHYCGSPTSRYYETSEFENLDKRLDLGTAMAISGAAASPYMGAVSIRGVRALLVLLNVRLGYWIASPAKPYNNSIVSQLFSAPGVLYVVRELFGKLRDDSRYINVSDGGHIENLGLYELLRRKCKFIIAIDAEADPTMSFGSLNRLQRLAKQDFNTTIDIDLGRLQPEANGRTRMHFALGKIHYDSNQEGFLLYIKSSLTGNEPHYLLDYQKRNPSFPHQSTADQFFDEDQFEVYRALGYHMGEELFAEELLESKEEPDSIRDWFQALANSLLRGKKVEGNK